MMMLDYKRAGLISDVGFIDPDKVHEVNIQDKPEEVKGDIAKVFQATT